MRRICVFCGSKPGTNPEFIQLAKGLGEELAQSGIELVFGGGHAGMMGAVADAVISNGGRVTGIIPEALVERESAHKGISKLITVPDMHSRKSKMYELSDAFIVLPGGLGTMDEFFEVFTWIQIGYHDKPLILMNSSQYYEPLLHFLDQMVDKGYTGSEIRNKLIVIENLRQIQAHL